MSGGGLQRDGFQDFDPPPPSSDKLAHKAPGGAALRGGSQASSNVVSPRDLRGGDTLEGIPNWDEPVAHEVSNV